MGQYSSYYLYQKYEKRGEQDWIPCYPNVYSISGDSSNPMTLVMKEENDPQCGYVPPAEPQYRWNVVDGFLCANCDTTKAMIHTSADTIYISGSGEITQAEVSGYASAATDVVITNDTTIIGTNAFSGFSGVEFVRIPNSVTSIGEKAFYGCSAMTECQIPYGTLSVGNSAFTNCTSLMYVDIPNSVTTLGNDCFNNCLNFRYASIPSSITNIPTRCFYNCDGLSDIEIPSPVSGIGDSAFAQCSGLYSITVPNTVTIFGRKERINNGYTVYGSTFYRCDKLSRMNSNIEGEINIPSGVTYIGVACFEYCSSIRSVIIPRGIPHLENSTFYGCRSLSSVTFAENCQAQAISMGTFTYCTSLKNITLPQEIRYIRVVAFSYCSGLTSVIIQDKVIKIEEKAFYECTSLENVTIYATTPPTLETDAFLNTSANLKIYVPSSSVDAYKAASGWSTYANKIYPIQ